MRRRPREIRPDKLKQRIAEEAARLMHDGADAAQSRFRAARRLTRGWVPEEHLPGHDAILREVNRAGDPTAGLAHLAGDRFDRIADLVRPLATVRQDPVLHPEGDLLEHTLQVFDRVHDERPFDEELLTAALVHEVGRAIDRSAAVAAALGALDGLITPRTRWLVEMLPAAVAHGERTLGARARQRLESHPDFLDVICLADCDRRARVRGYAAPSLEEAIAVLRTLAAEDETTVGG